LEVRLPSVEIFDMKMKLEIYLKKNKITILLKNGKKAIDKILWDDENNLSEKLLFEIEKLLRKNKVKKEEVRMKFTTDNPSGFTTMRIGKAVANAWNYAIKNQ